MLLTADTILVRVEAPHFTAGIVLRNGRCVLAAPILRWCVGKGQVELRLRFAELDYRATIVRSKTRPPAHQ